MRCLFPDSNNLKRFQQLENEVAFLEEIVGKKPPTYKSNLASDIKDLAELLKTLRVSVRLDDIKEPVFEKIDEAFTHVQLLMGIVDLLPKIAHKLELLRQAHDQSAKYEEKIKVPIFSFPRR